jgi:hypothetical protein
LLRAKGDSEKQSDRKHGSAKAHSTILRIVRLFEKTRQRAQIIRDLEAFVQLGGADASRR